MAAVVYFVVVLSFASMAEPSTSTCDVKEFQKCNLQVTDFSDSAFHVKYSFQLRDECEAIIPVVNCVKDYVSKCMKKEMQDIFQLTAELKLKIVEGLCTDGSDINTGFLKSIDCLKRVDNDILYCNEKFEKSQQIITEDTQQSRRLKLFYTCCAYDWHNKCKSKAVEAKCKKEDKEYMENMSALMVGGLIPKLCMGYPTYCFGLHGVEVEDLDKHFGTAEVEDLGENHGTNEFEDLGEHYGTTEVEDLGEHYGTAEVDLGQHYGTKEVEDLGENHDTYEVEDLGEHYGTTEVEDLGENHGTDEVEDLGENYDTTEVEDLGENHGTDEVEDLGEHYGTTEVEAWMSNMAQQIIEWIMKIPRMFA